MVGIILLLLVVSILVALLYYGLVFVPLLPLFLQVWVLEIFTDADMGAVLFIVTLVVSLTYVAFNYATLGKTPSKKQVGLVLVGIVGLSLGAAIFGSIWEVLQLTHQYQIEHPPSALGTSLCHGSPTWCLTDNETPYPDMLWPSIGSGAVWYLGLVGVIKGTE